MAGWKKKSWDLTTSCRARGLDRNVVRPFVSQSLYCRCRFGRKSSLGFEEESGQRWRTASSFQTKIKRVGAGSPESR